MVLNDYHTNLHATPRCFYGTYSKIWSSNTNFVFFLPLFRSVVNCSLCLCSNIFLKMYYIRLETTNYKSKNKRMRKKTDTHNCTWKHCEIVAQETGRVHEDSSPIINFPVPMSTRTHSHSFSYHSLNLSLWALKQLSLTLCPLAQKHFSPQKNQICHIS